MTTEKTTVEYTKPQVRDYGELRELTAALITGSVTDVPMGAPAPHVFST
jgi:hypothetical protein